MLFDVLTIFPALFVSPLEEGILRKARQEGKIQVRLTDIRDFADDRHATTDDRPFFFARAKPWGLPRAMRRAFIPSDGRPTESPNAPPSRHPLRTARFMEFQVSMKD